MVRQSNERRNRKHLGNTECTKCKLHSNAENVCLRSYGPVGGLLLLGEAPGCISGDSLIDTAFRDKSKCLNGVPIKDLVGKKDFFVYSYDIKNKKLVLGKVKRVWRTGRKKVYKVVYEWGFNKKEKSIVKRGFLNVSLNHPFLLHPYGFKNPFNGINKKGEQYLSLDTGLTIGNSLLPFSRVYNLYSFVGVSCKDRVKESRFLLENKIGRKLKHKEQTHHKNENKLDDTFDNIELLDIKAHASYHGKGVNNCMHNPIVRAKHRKIMLSEKYRDNQSKLLKKFLSNPLEYSKRLKQIKKSAPKIKKTLLGRYSEPLFYYKYLLSKRKFSNISDQRIKQLFKQKFANIAYPPIDNHKIISIDFVGMQDVYDMEVEKYHNFAVNGIFVHNSTEDKQNMPFVGKTGTFLRNRLLPPAGIDAEEVRYGNAVRCRPENNKTPTIGNILNCREYLEQEVKYSKPKVICLLGNVPLASALDFAWKHRAKSESKVSGISKWRGKKIWHREFNCWVVPTFHPSYVQRQFGAGSDTAYEQVIYDLEMANALVYESRLKFTMPESILITNVQLAKAAVMEMWEAGVYAFDIETGGTEMSERYVIGCSLSCSEKRGYYFPWDWLVARPNLYKLLFKLLNSKKHYKIMHNGAYEKRIFRINSLPLYDKYFDTMMAAQLVDENFYKGLKDLSWLHTSFGGYDVPLEKYKKEHKIKEDYSSIPLDILGKYGGLDSVATFILYKKFKRKLRAIDLLPTFTKISMPVRRVMSDSEYYGFRVDSERALKLSAMCSEAMLRLETKVYEEAGAEFNINSRPQLQNVLFKKIGLTPIKKIKTGYSTDASTMEQLATQEGGDIAGYLMDRSYIKTLQGTHIQQAITHQWADHRVHTNFNMTGAVTNRTTCLACGTLIPTERGIIPIETVIRGDYTISHTGERRRVLGCLYQGVKPVYRLTTAEGCNIICTSNHRFYTPDGWQEAKNVKEVFYVSIEGAYERLRVFGKGSESVCRRSGQTNDCSGCEEVGDICSKCVLGFKTNFDKGEVQGRSVSSCFKSEDGKQKPYVRENWRETSKLERDLLGQQGVSCVDCRWREVFSASCCNGKGYGNTSEESTARYDSAPYRRRSVKQFNRQFGALHQFCTSQITPKVAKVKVLSFVGEIQVFDLVIEGDESFVAGGFLVHNCSAPSLHNVPRDRLVRSLYIASEGCMLIDADLKQAELAYLAAESGEEVFLKAFAEGLDLHMETAKLIYGISDPTEEQRQEAKAINFGVIYGMTVIGLAKKLKMTIEEADDFIENYFDRLPKVADYMERSRTQAKELGYVSCLFNVRRRLPEAMSDDEYVVERALRQANNAPIQTGAAFYTYVGLIRLSKAIKKRKLRAKLVHTVHDCAITDTPIPEIDRVTELNRIAFETPIKLIPVKMRIDIEVSKRWGEHGDSKLEGVLNKVGLFVN